MRSVKIIFFIVFIVFIVFTGVAVRPARAAGDPLEELLQRTNDQVSAYLDRISEVSCSERVLQEKLGDSGKTVEKEESAFNYLILLSSANGDVNLVESRLAEEDKPVKKLQRPLLVSNGFATLFLVFHPYYAAGFNFTDGGEETVNGRKLAKIHFQHIPGTRTPAALAVGGREFPLDLTGMAWIDIETGTIARIVAGIDTGMEDVGLRTLRSDVRYSPVTFHNPPDTYWLPSEMTIEVETKHQHWRNTHRFSDYKKFSVNTKETQARQ
jgi:hypothetical protein